MTTHLRARAVQAGAFLALVGGAIAVAASPAQAAPPAVTIDSVSSTTIGPGDRVTLRYTVSVPPGNPLEPARVTISGMDCSGDCSPEIGAGQRQSFTANLTAGPVDAGDRKSVRVLVAAELDGETGTATRNITVRGPEKPKLVRQVSGRVKDSEGKSVSGAQVLMKDSAGHQYDTTSNGNGGYEFTSSDDRPIAPGTISIGAVKDGFEPAAVNVRAAADKTVNVTLTLVSKDAPPPTATPTPTDTALPLDDETDAADDATEAPAIDPNAASNNTEDDSGSMLFIILGGLLVAAGIGAIVLVLMRRKADGADDADGDKPARVTPPGQGRYGDDATRVAAPVGGRANDATMVAGLGAAPSLSDAPTMLHRAVPAEDEFPDPYGAPASPPQAGAYGAPGAYGGGTAAYGGYPEQEQQQYGGYGAATPTGTYGAAAAPPAQRYDEPTGMYRPDDQGYLQPEPEYPPAGRSRPEPTGAYQAGGYDADQGGYGAGGWAGDGADNGNAYGGGYPEQEQQQYGGGYGAPAGTYGAPAGGGYDGYGGEQQGYDPRATYGRPEGYGPEQGGATYGQQGNYGGGTYGAPAGGYDAGAPGYDGGGAAGRGYEGGEQGGGRHGAGGARPQDPGHPGQRRSLDWLDD